MAMNVSLTDKLINTCKTSLNSQSISYIKLLQIIKFKTSKMELNNLFENILINYKHFQYQIHIFFKYFILLYLDILYSALFTLTNSKQNQSIA